MISVFLLLDYVLADSEILLRGVIPVEFLGDAAGILGEGCVVIEFDADDFESAGEAKMVWGDKFAVVGD